MWSWGKINKHESSPSHSIPRCSLTALLAPSHATTYWDRILYLAFESRSSTVVVTWPFSYRSMSDSWVIQRHFDLPQSMKQNQRLSEFLLVGHWLVDRQQTFQIEAAECCEPSAQVSISSIRDLISPTSGVSLRTSGSMRSKGSTPILWPLRLVTKLTQNASFLGLPRHRMALVSRPNCRDISILRGLITWALGAASRVGYFSTTSERTAVTLSKRRFSLSCI